MVKKGRDAGSGLYDIWKMEQRAWAEGPDGARGFTQADALIVPPAPMPLQSFEAFRHDAARAAAFTDVELTDRTFVEADGTVVIAYRASARHKRFRRRYRARCMTVYARQEGGWRVVAHHHALES